MNEVEYHNPRQLEGPPDEAFEEELPEPDIEGEIESLSRLMSLTYEEGWPILQQYLEGKLQAVVNTMVWAPPEGLLEARGRAQTLREVLDLPKAWRAQIATLSEQARSTGSNPEPPEEGE